MFTGTSSEYDSHLFAFQSFSTPRICVIRHKLLKLKCFFGKISFLDYIIPAKLIKALETCCKMGPDNIQLHYTS